METGQSFVLPVWISCFEMLFPSDTTAPQTPNSGHISHLLTPAKIRGGIEEIPESKGMSIISAPSFNV